jgi:hypothetical protein
LLPRQDRGDNIRGEKRIELKSRKQPPAAERGRVETQCNQAALERISDFWMHRSERCPREFFRTPRDVRISKKWRQPTMRAEDLWITIPRALSGCRTLTLTIAPSQCHLALLGTIGVQACKEAQMWSFSIRQGMPSKGGERPYSGRLGNDWSPGKSRVPCRATK